MTTTGLAQAIQMLDRATSTPELVRATQALCALNDLEAAKRTIAGTARSMGLNVR